MLTLNEKEKRAIIEALVTNCAGWDEEDVDLLTNLSDRKLFAHARRCAQLIANADPEDNSGLPGTLEPESASTQEHEAEDEGWEDETLDDAGSDDGLDGPPSSTDETEDLDQPKRCHDEQGNEVECGDSSAARGENVTKNELDWLAKLPPRVQSVVTNALKFEDQQKRILVGQIVANRRNRFSKNYLMGMGIDELQALSELAAPVNNRSRQPLYVGPGGPTFNEAFSTDRDDVLIPPTLEFTKN